MRQLAADGARHVHRLPLTDLTVAVAARDAGLAVLHFDRHFDRLSDALNIDARWLDRPAP